MKYYSLLVITTLLLGLQACSSNSNDTNPMVDLGGDASGVISNENVVAIPQSITTASRSIIFDYTMPSISGGSTIARAQLFEPNTPAPEDGHSLVVWAHGTTGISNACTPSASFDDFGYAGVTNALLSAGYAVLAPDYEGFGTANIHPYYQRTSHANAITASIPAVHKLSGTNLSDDWAILGHSQGGHVALAAARAPALPAYPLQAVVALAPGTDLAPFSDRAFELIDENIAEGDEQVSGERLFYLNVYAAYVAHGLKEAVPTFDPKSIFGEEIAPLIDQALDETYCGEYADSVFETLGNYLKAGGTVSDFQGLKRDWYTEPTVAARLDSEAMGDEAQSAPLLIVQGDADRQIPIAATTAFVDRQRSVGTDVTYEIIAGGRHGTVVNSEFSSTISWLNERFPAQ